MSIQSSKRNLCVGSQWTETPCAFTYKSLLISSLFASSWWHVARLKTTKRITGEALNWLVIEGINKWYLLIPSKGGVREQDGRG